jgi:hypothetical protein
MTRRMVAVAALLCGALLIGCQASADVVVGDPTIVSWPGVSGSTAGQVIVTVRNDGERPVDPDVLVGDRMTMAHLLDGDGEELPGGDARVQLHAVPYILGPGETGYLVGAFDLAEPADRIADARVEVNATQADARAPVSIEDFELVDGEGGVGGAGRMVWDGSGTAVARAIALDVDGTPLGFLATSEVLYDSGDFTMCCFPPTVELEQIDDVVVFGFQAREEN